MDLREGIVWGAEKALEGALTALGEATYLGLGALKVVQYVRDLPDSSEEE